MEKHNTHILLESNCSDQHDYEEDENGKLKIDTYDDIPYQSFISKKPKISIKEILIENNNIFKQELEKEKLFQEMLLKSQKKKKIKTENYIKGNEYRFNESKIKPCFNEIDIKYNNDKFVEIFYDEQDKQNLSQEIKKRNQKFNDDINNEKNKRKRNTMQNLKHKKIIKISKQKKMSKKIITNI